MKLVLTLTILVGILLLEGCSRTSLTIVFNNTDENLFLKTGKGWVNLSPGDKFENSIGAVLTMKKGNEQFEYHGNKAAYPPEFVGRKHAGRLVFAFQLQLDLKLHIVRPDSVFPVKQLPTQPNGFPLIPVLSQYP